MIRTILLTLVAFNVLGFFVLGAGIFLELFEEARQSDFHRSTVVDFEARRQQLIAASGRRAS